jgi:hypothetical protein
VFYPTISFYIQKSYDKPGIIESDSFAKSERHNRHHRLSVLFGVHYNSIKSYIKEGYKKLMFYNLSNSAKSERPRTQSQITARP